MSVMTRSARPAVVACAAAALVLTGCSSGNSDAENSDVPFKTVKSGVLTVASYGSSPPIIVQQNGKLTGLIGEVVNGFAKEHGLKVELFETDFAAALAATQQGRTDFTVFIYHNAERAKTVYYTAPIFQLPASVITHKNFSWSGPESLKGKKIGAVIGEVWSPYLKAAFGGNVKLFQSDTEAATALINGQVDAYVNSALQMLNKPIVDQDDLTYHLLKVGDLKMPASVITNRGTNIVSCENPELAKSFDKYLREINKSGKLQKIEKRLKIPKEFWIDDFTAPKQGCGN